MSAYVQEVRNTALSGRLLRICETPMESPAWQQILIAFSLVLVIEGIIPFLYPGRWRRLVAQLALVDDRTLRIVGLVSMMSGVGLLFLVT
jgi:uncharacterized protein YjeT (DUF2065 family)